MKTKVTLLLLTMSLISICSTAQIQLDNNKKTINRLQTPPQTLKNINFSAIKTNLDKKTVCYQVLVAATYSTIENTDAIIAYGTGKLKSEREYLRANFEILRSDNRFASSRGNAFEVIMRSSGDSFSAEGVKITWRFPDVGLQTFMLENVHVQYGYYGITISGSKKVENKLIGFSITIQKTECQP